MFKLSNRFPFRLVFNQEFTPQTTQASLPFNTYYNHIADVIIFQYIQYVLHLATLLELLEALVYPTILKLLMSPYIVLIPSTPTD